MIEIHLIDGAACPVAVCDICHDPISSHEDGVANYDADGGNLRLLHFECQPYRGQDSFQRCWTPLRLFWRQLGHNLKIDE